jgi:glycosyltransferase 2 family protein
MPTAPFDFLMTRNRLFFFASLLMLIPVVSFIRDPKLLSSFETILGNVSDIPLRVLALVGLLKATQSLLSALAWRNVLVSTFPDNPPPYRLVLGLDQGKEAVNVISPAKIGTWVMMSGLRVAIPGAQMPTLITAWGAQSLAYVVFAVVNSLVLGLTLPSVVGAHPAINVHRLSFITARPLLNGVVALAAIVLLMLLVRRLWPRVARVRGQIVAGAAILGSPWRYLGAVFLPSLLSYLCRIAIFGVVMASFGIKLTVVTLILALAAHAVAGAIRFTPSGFGTTQAIDLLILHTFASAATITAYSLTEGMLMTTLSLVFGIAALIWALGWTQAKGLVIARSER